MKNLSLALDRIASGVSVSGKELEDLCRTHGRAHVLRGLLARCTPRYVREYRSAVRALRRSTVPRGQELAVAAWAAMRSY